MPCDKLEGITKLEEHSERKRKRVLVVSFDFPPNPGAGAITVDKLMKYLPDFGWDPIVVSVNGISKNNRNLTIPNKQINIWQYSFTSRIAAKFNGNAHGSTPVLSVSQPKNNKNRADSKIIYQFLKLFIFLSRLPLFRELFEPHGWANIAQKQCITVIAQNPIDLIFSSYGPSVNHFVASAIQKKAGIPWVAEFRDLWSDNHYIHKIQPLHYLEQLLEKKILKNSAQLTTVSEFWATKMHNLHHKPCLVIKNGYDKEDYLERIDTTKIFTITYTGMIYINKQDPSPLFKAIGILISESFIKQDDIMVRFYGTDCDWLRKLIFKHGLEGIVKIYPSIPHDEICKRQMESTLLLLLGWNDKKEIGVYPSKVFEYIGARRPIISLSREDEYLSQLIRDTGCGVTTQDIKQIVECLKQCIIEHRSLGKSVSFYHPNQPIIDSLSRKANAKQMASLFGEILSKHNTRV